MDGKVVCSPGFGKNVFTSTDSRLSFDDIHGNSLKISLRFIVFYLLYLL